MREPLGSVVVAAALWIMTACVSSPPPEGTRIRVATFNIKELTAAKVGADHDPQLAAAAEILQRVRPDILLINEIDGNDDGRTLTLFRDRYLAVSHGGQAPLAYPHVFSAEVNTGVPSGLDLDRDGRVDGPADSWGFGRYPGQYAMAVVSRFPIAAHRSRTFRHFRWRDLPGHLMPDGRDGRPPWYGPAEAEVLRLSSKSHWDVPVEVAGTDLHLLASHPTPPSFDGDEDRNGRRNFDEIRLWSCYLDGASWMMDDAGRRGGLEPGAAFVILGDLNADPDGAVIAGRPAIAQLLDHPRVRDPVPRGPGGVTFDRDAPGDRTTWTQRWGRLDYVLPSVDLEVVASGVFFPAPGDPLHELALTASDHRLVWLDLVLPSSP